MSTIASNLACIKIYDPIHPEDFDKVYRVGETCAGTKLIDNRLHIVFQGTENVPGWMADFDINPIVHPILGTLHGGFWQNIEAILEQIKPDIPSNVEIEVDGHSKGAGEGVQAAGELHAEGYNVVQVNLYACPNAGYQDFADYMQKHITGISWRNSPGIFEALGDPVPLVPPHPFVPPYPHTMMDVPPGGVVDLIGVEWHRGALYDAGAI